MGGQRRGLKPELWGIQHPDLCWGRRGQQRRLRRSGHCNFKRSPNIKSFKSENIVSQVGRWCEARTSLARAVSVD